MKLRRGQMSRQRAKELFKKAQKFEKDAKKRGDKVKTILSPHLKTLT